MNSVCTFVNWSDVFVNRINLSINWFHIYADHEVIIHVQLIDSVLSEPHLFIPQLSKCSE